jgi:hypothetical protein
LKRRYAKEKAAVEETLLLERLLFKRHYAERETAVGETLH